MKIYELKNKKRKYSIPHHFLSKRTASDFLFEHLKSNQDCNVFDFELVEIEKDITEKLNSPERSFLYLGECLTQITLPIGDKKKSAALTSLQTSARAWHIALDYHADYRNRAQERYFPSFYFSNNGEFHVFSNDIEEEVLQKLSLGHLITFPSQELADKFGNTFITYFQKLFS